MDLIDPSAGAGTPSAIITACRARSTAWWASTQRSSTMAPRPVIRARARLDLARPSSSRASSGDLQAAVTGLRIRDTAL